MAEHISITLRRKAEERHVSALRNLAENSKLLGVADFSARSDGKVKGALMRRKIAEQNALIREKLDERRRKLALLLTEERHQYEREIEASFETPEQVKERMFAKARALKAENDAARQALADELERKRFMQSSDVLRARASVITAERTALDRLSQLHERQRAQELEAQREKAEAEELAAAQAKLQSRAAVEAEAKRRLAAEVRGALGAQVHVSQALRATERDYERHTDGLILEEDRAAAAALRAADIGRRVAAREEYHAVSAYNASEASVKSRSAAAEAEADKAELAAALRREADAVAAERAAADTRKAETLEFRRELAEQMVEQAAAGDWADRHYAEEQEKEWAKRQAVWDADAEARKALAAGVAATRDAQVADKARQREAERAREGVQVAAAREALAAGDMRERVQAEARRRLAAEQAEATRQQLAERERAREAENQAEYLTWRLQQKQERDYATRVEALLKDPATFARR